MSANIDMESGETNPNPMNMMHENPELRWSFSRKVYSIITFQLLLTIAFTSVVTFVPPVANFINSKQGNILCTVLFFVPFIILCPLYYYHLKYPLNYFFFLIFNVSLAIVFGFACGIASGNIQILEVAILTTVMMFILILYTFWAAKRGHDFSYLGSFLSGSLSVLILLGLIQILSPLGKLSHMIF
ncbi:protein LIFEGUARD [Trifolium repens]|nr:protein LIFEGUARD [Trifolium repens]